jgi:hypothetical protein
VVEKDANFLRGNVHKRESARDYVWSLAGHAVHFTELKNFVSVSHRFTKICIKKFSSYEPYNEARAHHLAPYPDANSLIRNIRNKMEHMLTESASPTEPVEAGEGNDSVRRTFCFGCLVKYYSLFPLFVCYVVGNKIVVF